MQAGQPRPLALAAMAFALGAEARANGVVLHLDSPLREALPSLALGHQAVLDAGY